MFVHVLISASIIHVSRIIVAGYHVFRDYRQHVQSGNWALIATGLSQQFTHSAQLRRSSRRAWQSHTECFKHVRVLTLVCKCEYICAGSCTSVCAQTLACVRLQDCVFFAFACPCECLRGEMWSRVRLTHPSAGVAAGSETSQGPVCQNTPADTCSTDPQGRRYQTGGEETRMNR